MSTPAQVLANRLNAQASTGPVTGEGKAISSRNAAGRNGVPGLFSLTAFIRPGEQPEFDALSGSLTAELRPHGALELTLVREVIHASWRLRRCALAESSCPAETDDGAHRPPLGRPLCAVEEMERLQISIDRARSAAHRTLFRSLNELRRLRAAQPGPFDSLAEEASRGLTELRLTEALRLARPDFANQTQSPPLSAPAIARNALCPCGSGDKFKRCCGKSAPPVLGMRPPDAR